MWPTTHLKQLIHIIFIMFTEWWSIFRATLTRVKVLRCIKSMHRAFALNSDVLYFWLELFFSKIKPTFLLLIFCYCEISVSSIYISWLAQGTSLLASLDCFDVNFEVDFWFFIGTLSIMIEVLLGKIHYCITESILISPSLSICSIAYVMITALWWIFLASMHNN